MNEKIIILQAELLKIQIEVEGMKALNAQRAHKGEDVAYNEDWFYKMAQQVESALQRFYES